MSTFQPSKYSFIPPTTITLPTTATTATTSDSSDDGVNAAGVAAVGVGLAALLAVPTFVINPWIIKAFKPEWSYGRRVAAGMGINAAFALVKGLSSK